MKGARGGRSMPLSVKRAAVMAATVGLPVEAAGVVFARTSRAGRHSPMIRYLLLVGMVLLLARADAAEKLRRNDGPAADANYFENNRDARLEQWIAPVYPAEVGIAERGIIPVRVSFTVDEQGALRDIEVLSGDERFHEAALAALRQWRFRPAMSNGKNEARSLRTTFLFRAGRPTEMKNQGPDNDVFESSPETAPQDRHTPEPVYPRHLVKRALAGEVELVLGIDEQGRVSGVEVVRATHPDFVAAAFSTVESWQMIPARRGRLPINGEKGAVLSFRVIDTETDHTAHENWLEQNGIRLADANAPEARLYFDRIPEMVSFIDPVYPAELRIKGVVGEAVVDFTVDKSGSVVAAAIRRASEEPFGAALLAAVSAWRFQTLYHGGEAAWVDFQVTWKFELPGEHNTAPEMLAVLAPDAPRAGARQLDGKIEPLHLVAPTLQPGETAGGYAEIEIIINRDGRACWPRIVKADTPAVGWAAATAVSSWYFATPRKGGQPVSVRVIVPVEVAPRK